MFFFNVRFFIQAHHQFPHIWGGVRIFLVYLGIWRERELRGGLWYSVWFGVKPLPYFMWWKMPGSLRCNIKTYFTGCGWRGMCAYFISFHLLYFSFVITYKILTFFAKHMNCNIFIWWKFSSQLQIQDGRKSVSKHFK